MSGLKMFGWFVLGIVGISAASLALKLALAPVNMAHTAVNSASGVVSKTLDSNNVIASYEWFHDVDAQFEARIGQIKAHRSLVNAELMPQEKSRLNIELAAMQQSCRELATKYNANSQKINKSLFKGRSLPEVLTITNCEGK